jgi:hypothetical protein
MELAQSIISNSFVRSSNSNGERIGRGSGLGYEADWLRMDEARIRTLDVINARNTNARGSLWRGNENKGLDRRAREVKAELRVPCCGLSTCTASASERRLGSTTASAVYSYSEFEASRRLIASTRLG